MTSNAFIPLEACDDAQSAVGVDHGREAFAQQVVFVDEVHADGPRRFVGECHSFTLPKTARNS
ncbi:hypothetical protein OG909_21365 [Streptomyces sp. NBC_01754]|uniref:hypothetical protein n=1 Tax=Streptomyces sp. NBC_01754 TaxID=2975930 RepID=UPI002DD8F3EE|nr:hypothetical protein [Streptomyces sp. NBC_01754]WSC94616.1 hypothetical protein OG909_21365 [Streptomyces sp. NBC_01754]